MGRVVPLVIAMSLMALVGVVAWRGAALASQPLPPAAEADPTSAMTQRQAAAPGPISSATPQTGEASLCSSPAPATPTPFNGATEESPGGNASPRPQSPADAAPIDGSYDVSGEDPCTGVGGPTPVIAEAPLPILLPLTATAALGGALLLFRRRGKAQREARGKEAADGE
jgi:hypothetical protein